MIKTLQNTLKQDREQGGVYYGQSTISKNLDLGKQPLFIRTKFTENQAA